MGQRKSIIDRMKEGMGIKPVEDNSSDADFMAGAENYDTNGSAHKAAAELVNANSYRSREGLTDAETVKQIAVQKAKNAELQAARKARGQ